MAEVYIAIKPKYPTRRAVDKTLFNEDNFVTIINEKSVRQLGELMETSQVALISNNKYYPVKIENCEEQFNLVKAGSVPTVSEEAGFGVKKISYFASATSTTGLDNVQTGIQVYNGIIRGTLYKVLDYSKIGKAAINKNGYWFVFSYDLTNASAEGYSSLKFFDGTNVASGDNYLFVGNNDEEISKYILSIKGTLTINSISYDVSESFDCHFKTAVMIPGDEVNAVEVDGKAFASLKAAFAAIPNGGTVVVNKSITETEKTVIENGKVYSIIINNNASINFNGCYVHVKSGSLRVAGNGTMQEVENDYCPIMLENLDQNKSVYVCIESGITLKGWTGLFFNKASYNLVADVAGKCIGQKDKSSAEGAGIYVNGSVISGSLTFTGSTEGSIGLGIFQSGNINTKIINAICEGSNTGYEIRSGSVYIEGSKIVSTSTEEPAMVSAGNGSSSTACGVAVAQHTTKKPINVVIQESTVVGSAAIMEGNPEQNPTATADTSISVNSGVFVGLVKTLTPASDCTKFLFGGRYSAKPDDMYVGTGYKSQKTSNNKWEIVKI